MTEIQDSKRERVLVGARKLFARYGMRKTTVEDIAREAGLGKGTVYLYFNSKEDLYLAVVRKEATQFLQKLRATLEDAAHVQKMSAIALLRVFMLTKLRLLGELINLHGITKEALSELSQSREQEALFWEFEKESMGLVDKILRFGNERGEFAVDDPELASLVIMATMRSVEAPWVQDEGEVGYEHKVEALLRLLTSGMLKR